MQLEAAQTARVEELARNLLRYTDELFAENASMFEMHMRNMATEKLATAAYGPVMLVTLGKVYCLQAKRSRGNLGAYFKCALEATSRSAECLAARSGNGGRTCTDLMTRRQLCTLLYICVALDSTSSCLLLPSSIPLQNNEAANAAFSTSTALTWCRQQKDKIGGTFQMVNAAVKVMQHQQQFEKEDPRESGRRRAGGAAAPHAGRHVGQQRAGHPNDRGAACQQVRVR